MRIMKLTAVLLAVVLLTACGAASIQTGGVAATTAPVAQFAAAITEGTDIPVTQVISDSVSCLHDYTLSVRQMQTLEQSELVLLSGVGLETFLDEAMTAATTAVDCSEGVHLLKTEAGEDDPHIWLSPTNAMVMAENICAALTERYPMQEDRLRMNTDALLQRLQELDAYGRETLMSLPNRDLITFHDGFAYLANAYGLNLLAAVEEESGSEASAADLTQIVGLVNDYELPAVFTEVNGSSAAASIIAAETDVEVFVLNMAMGEDDYFDAMKYNFDTLKEALQ